MDGVGINQAVGLRTRNARDATTVFTILAIGTIRSVGTIDTILAIGHREGAGRIVGIMDSVSVLQTIDRRTCNGHNAAAVFTVRSIRTRGARSARSAIGHREGAGRIIRVMDGVSVCQTHRHRAGNACDAAAVFTVIARGAGSTGGARSTVGHREGGRLAVSVGDRIGVNQAIGGRARDAGNAVARGTGSTRGACRSLSSVMTIAEHV